MWEPILIYGAILGVLFQTVGGLDCYRCHSSQPGCGKELNIRLQRWHNCPGTGDGGGENFCVKVIERKGSTEFYTRECLMTLREHTGHREKIPKVQRHGYCEFARNNDPWDREDESRTYCFCNDWNGCNGAPSRKVYSTGVAGLALLISAFIRMLL